MIAVTLILLIVPFFLLLFYNFYWKRRCFPPGPVPLPLVGNLLAQNTERPIYDKYLSWARQYGPVFTFWFGERPTVMVTDYDLIMDAFVKNTPEATSGRSTLDVMVNEFRGGLYGIVDTDGEAWKEQRRFSLHVLRNFGVGRNVMEEKVLDEVAAMLTNLRRESSAGAVDVNEHLEVCIGSIINNLLLGYRFEGNRLSEFHRLKGLISAHMRCLGQPFTMLTLLIPATRHLPVCREHFKQATFRINELFAFFDNQIDEHARHLDLENAEEPTDYVEAYLREIHRRKNTNSSYSRMQLRNIVGDLWVAGMETTSNTCQFAVNYLLNHPETHARVEAELGRVVGSERLVTMQDKPHLPFLQATINEVQRFSNLVPLNLHHRTMEDIELAGFKLPAGTAIVPMISCVLANPKVFPEPEKFNPDRFLDVEGNLAKVEELIPFGVGKRQCLGESLARMELFLVLSNLLNQFHLHPEHEGKPPSMQKLNGLSVQVEPFKVRLSERKH